MLVKTISTPQEFMNEMQNMGRDQFSYEGYEALLNLFDEDGYNTEFDAIAICCEFNEDTPEDIAERYGYDEEIMDEDSLITFLDYLNNHTWAELLDNGNIIYQEF